MTELPDYEELKQRVRELERECLELRRADSDLKAIEQRHRFFFDNAPLPCHFLDENGCLLDVNASWLRTFGYEREEVVGSFFSDFLHPDWQAYFTKNFSEIRRSGFAYVQQIKIRHKHGHFLDISFDGCTSRQPGNGPLRSCCILKDITELKQVEDGLYLTQYSIDSVNDCIFWIDENGNFSSANDATCARLGYSRGELLSMAVADIDPFFPREQWLEHWQELRDKGFLTFETVYYTKAGAIFPVEVTVNSLNYRGRQYNCAIARDVTRRVRTTEELNQFKYVLDNTLDMIFMFDAETLQFVYFNRGAMESLLYSREELLQLHPYDIKPHFSEQVFRKIIAPLLDGEQEVLSYETIHRRKNGQDFPVEVTLQLVRNPNGSRRFVAIVRDITARKQSEDALRRAKDEWENTFDAIPDIITIMDEDMRIVMANKKAHEVFQVKSGTLEGKYCYEVFRGTDKPCSECPALSTYRDYSHHRENVTHKNLGRIFNVTSSSVLDENGDLKYVVNIVKDITEYKRLESQLFRDQKIESISSLTSGIAHDFNNILMGLFGNISLARLELGSNHHVSEMLEEAEKFMGRATGLTHQLLTFARGGEPVKKMVRLDRLVRENPHLNLGNIRPVYDIAEELWPVEVDKDQIEQVFSNLALNADEAMPGGGQLYLSMENADIPVAEGLNLKPGKYIRVTLRDEGAGIEPDILERIFEPYFTTMKEGRGLGLATVYAIVNRHGGHISVDSDPGEGTTVTLYLPATDSARLGMPESDEHRTIWGQQPPRVLVMDDEEMVRVVSEKMLLRNGFIVEMAADGREAIEKYRQAMASDKRYDMVVVDLTVPGGMGGRETIGELLKIDPEVRAVISSGYAEDPVMENYEDYGFKGVVKKPFQAEDLLDVSYRVLNS